MRIHWTERLLLLSMRPTWNHCWRKAKSRLILVRMSQLFQPFIREAEVAHGPEKDMIRTEIVVPVIEIPTTEPVKQMIGSGLIAASVEGVAVQNGLTTLSQVCRRMMTTDCCRRISKRQLAKKCRRRFSSPVANNMDCPKMPWSIAISISSTRSIRPR